MIQKLKNIFRERDKKRLLSNIFYLFLLQGANYILPLITLPYLVRVLGPEKFGLIMFAQAFIQYFVILTDYGFNLSATKEVSIYRDNKKKLSEIFSAVMFIKLGLFFLSFFLLTLIVVSFDKFRQDWIIYYLTFGVVLGQVLFPVWLFQGLEKMRYISILNILARLTFTILVFTLIKSISDYIYVPLLNSIGFIFSGVLSLYLVFKVFNLRIKKIPLNMIYSLLRESFQFFLSRTFVLIYTVSNTFFLGLFSNNTLVGYYSIAEKLYNALQQVYNPIAQAIYPYMAKFKDKKFFKKLFYYVIFFNIFFLLNIFIFSYDIISYIFGKDFYVSTEIFRIFILTNFIVVPSILIGYPFLAALGFPKYANNSVIYGSILHTVGLILLIFMSKINVYTIAYMVLITETFVLFYRLYGIRKNYLWRTN